MAMAADVNDGAGAGPDQAPPVRPEPLLAGGSSASAAPEPLVDPAVARAKFEREVADYRRMEGEYLRRGWVMVRAEFPEVMVLLAAPQLNPRVVVFGVVLDFTNYDLWAPSVRFVDPFTLEPLLHHQVSPLYKRPAAPAPPMGDAVPVGGMPAGTPVVEGEPQPAPLPADHPAGAPQGIQFVLQSMPQNLLQGHATGIPFLCIAGVREYHEHPFHSNDPWLAHRRTGIGTLHHILDVIHRHGIAPLAGWDYDIAFQVQAARIAIDPNRLPE
jgi:hypothetical protein